MTAPLDVAPTTMLEIAYAQARLGLAEGGIPIGAALFAADGTLLGQGRNRRVQHDDPCVHGETDAFRNAGRQSDYRSTIMVTTLSPCWFCCGLIKQFNIGSVIIGENTNFRGGEDWLIEHGVSVSVLGDADCISMMGEFIDLNPLLWNEDIGVAETETEPKAELDHMTEPKATTEGVR